MPRPPIRLRTMSEADFQALSPRIVQEYAVDRSRNFGTTIEEETRVALRQYTDIARNIKQGRTRACFIQVGRAKVGYLVYTYHARRRYAYLDDIEVFERYRRRGYAEAALRLLEDEVVEKGARAIGLNVFGDNLPAKKLYEKSGYSFAFHGMRKRL